MAVRFKNRDYTQREVEIACALKTHRDTSDDTIGMILAFKQGGIGAPPIDCTGLVYTLERSNHAVYRRVDNNRAYWKPEADRVYREWMGAMSQTVRSLEQRGQLYPLM